MITPKFRKLVVEKLSSNFRDATRVVESSGIEAAAVKPNSVVVRNVFAGINASDINYTAGIYRPGVAPPFGAGFESVGEVVAVGDDVKGVKPGDSVAATSFSAFAEYSVVPEQAAVKVPAPRPEFIPMLVSGLTASIALDEVGEMKSGETVLVTAAAGGTGVFAVQFAKQAGNHVIGTCSSDAKAEALRKLGCDRAINYKKESLMEVLKTEYPDGVDIVYESVGGSMFVDCMKNLAVKGRLIVIGMISGYKDQSAWTKGKGSTSIPAEVLKRSASVRGFFLNHYAEQWGPHAAKMTKMWMGGKLDPVLDASEFEGLDAVADAVDHLYSGKNVGKVVVRIGPDSRAAL